MRSPISKDGLSARRSSTLWPRCSGNWQGRARDDRPDDGHESSRRPLRSFLSRLTTNEWLTFLVGVGSLVVSYMTYRTAADTSDIKDGHKQFVRTGHPN